MDDLFIDDREVPEHGKEWAAREARRLNEISKRPMPEKGEEIIIDTFMREGHTSWRATERPEAGVVHSDGKKLNGPEYDNSEGQAEAASIQEQLKAFREARGRNS